MRIGVFSDDLAGPCCALLLANGLACLDGGASALVDGCVPFVGVSEDRGADPRRGGARWTVGTHRSATAGRGDLVHAVPLSALRDPDFRSLLDVAITVGRDHPASARAMRAARYAADGGGDGPPEPVPPWFLALSHQTCLRTQADLTSTGSIALPFGTRCLPFMLPRPLDADVHDLAAGDIGPDTRRTAILLASLAVAAGARPHARRLEPSSLATLMAARATVGERAVSDRLLRLAAAFEELDASTPDARRSIAASRATDRRQLPSRRGPASRDGACREWAAPRRGLRTP